MFAAMTERKKVKKKRRPGGGRKPLDTPLKKEPIRTFVEQMYIDAFGGEEKCVEKAYKYLVREGKKIIAKNRLKK